MFKILKEKEQTVSTQHERNPIFEYPFVCSVIMDDSSNLQFGLIVIHLPIMQIQPCLSVIYGEGISDNLRKFMCSGVHLFLDNMK